MNINIQWCLSSVFPQIPTNWELHISKSTEEEEEKNQLLWQIFEILIKFTICMFEISMENGDQRFKSANRHALTDRGETVFFLLLYIDWSYWIFELQYIGGRKKKTEEFYWLR